MQPLCYYLDLKGTFTERVSRASEYLIVIRRLAQALILPCQVLSQLLVLPLQSHYYNFGFY